MRRAAPTTVGSCVCVSIYFASPAVSCDAFCKLNRAEAPASTAPRRAQHQDVLSYSAYEAVASETSCKQLAANWNASIGAPVQSDEYDPATLLAAQSSRPSEAHVFICFVSNQQLLECC